MPTKNRRFCLCVVVPSVEHRSLPFNTTTTFEMPLDSSRDASVYPAAPDSCSTVEYVPVNTTLAWNDASNFAKFCAAVAGPKAAKGALYDHVHIVAYGSGNLLAAEAARSGLCAPVPGADVVWTEVQAAGTPVPDLCDDSPIDGWTGDVRARHLAATTGLCVSKGSSYGASPALLALQPGYAGLREATVQLDGRVDVVVATTASGLLAPGNVWLRDAYWAGDPMAANSTSQYVAGAPISALEYRVIPRASAMATVFTQLSLRDVGGTQGARGGVWGTTTLQGRHQLPHDSLLAPLPYSATGAGVGSSAAPVLGAGYGERDPSLVWAALERYYDLAELTTRPRRHGAPDAPVHGGWSEWGAWGACSPPCHDTAERVRSRTCSKPKPAFGGQPCPGGAAGGREAKACTAADMGTICNVDGGFGLYIWGSCSADCGSGTRTGTRSCTLPPPSGPSPAVCAGATTTTRACNTQPCAPAAGSLRAAAVWPQHVSGAQGVVDVTWDAVDASRVATESLVGWRLQWFVADQVPALTMTIDNINSTGARLTDLAGADTNYTIELSLLRNAGSAVEVGLPLAATFHVNATHSGLPSRPTGLRHAWGTAPVAPATTTELTLSWEAPSLLAGATVLRYHVTLFTNGVQVLPDVTATTATASLQLNAASDHMFQVRAETSNGIGAPSDLLQVEGSVAADALEVPASGLYVRVVAADAVLVTWHSAPAPAFYEVWASPANGTTLPSGATTPPLVQLPPRHSELMDFTLEGLVSGINYTISVRGAGASGTVASAVTSEMVALPPAGAPHAPLRPMFTGSSASLDVFSTGALGRNPIGASYDCQYRQLGNTSAGSGWQACGTSPCTVLTTQVTTAERPVTCSVPSGDVPVEVAYEVRVRAVSSGAVAGPWSLPSLPLSTRNATAGSVDPAGATVVLDAAFLGESIVKFLARALDLPADDSKQPVLLNAQKLGGGNLTGPDDPVVVAVYRGDINFEAGTGPSTGVIGAYNALNQQATLLLLDSTGINDGSFFDGAALSVEISNPNKPITSVLPLNLAAGSEACSSVLDV